MAPWKNGIWANLAQLSGLYKIQDSQMDFVQFMYFDYPDISPLMSGTWNFGDFGEAKNEVKVASGVENYNLEIKIGVYMSQFGVVMHFWNFNFDSVFLFFWEKLTENQNDPK